MKFFYIIITAAFAQHMAGRQSSVNHGNYFNYAVTIDSTYVISSNAVNDFPNEIDSFANTQPDSVLTMLYLAQKDFPQTPPIK